MSYLSFFQEMALSTKVKTFGPAGSTLGVRDEGENILEKFCKEYQHNDIHSFLPQFLGGKITELMEPIIFLLTQLQCIMHPTIIISLFSIGYFSTLTTISIPNFDCKTNTNHVKIKHRDHANRFLLNE